jgi:ATP-dependent RNA helicase RhlE
VHLSQVEVFVLDEADRMLDMGFIPDIKRIMALLPKDRQNLLFSATFSNDIKKLADELLNKPQLIEVARRNSATETVTQSVYKVPQEAKRALLTHIVTSRNVWQVLCFVRTKHGASRLARQLEKDGLETSAIHGDKTQAARLEALTAFKEGKLQVLVATDVAARGLDIDDLPLVINYELPHVPEDYVHRIGRTGRAGAKGEAIALVDPAEEKHLVEIEKLLKSKITVATPDDFDMAAAHAPRERASERTSERPSRERGSTTRTRERGTAERRTSAHETRRPTREEREDAYAKNPDQPLIVARSTRAAPGARSGATTLPLHTRPGLREREVPALLKKRSVLEPEKV